MRGLRGTLVSLILLAILPGFVLLAYSDLEEIRGLDQRLDEDARRFAGLAVLRQRTLIASAQQVLVTVSRLSEVRSLDSKRCGSLLADLSREHLMFANLGAVDLNGILRCSAVPAPPGTNLAGRRYVREALTWHRLSSGQFVTDRFTKNATLNFGAPIVDDHATVGAAFIAIDLRSLNDFGDQAFLPQGARLYLLDPSGVILRVAPEHRELIGLPIRTVLPSFSGAAGRTLRIADAGGEPVVVAGDRLDTLSVICVLPEKGVLAQAERKNHH